VPDQPKFNPNRGLPFLFGDIFQIRSELSHYELKGIEKIVNIMAGQYAQNKSLTEETLESEVFSEFESEQLNETTLTDSTTSTVERATADVLSEADSFGVSADVTLTYGVVRANAGFAMESQSSQTHSETEAESFAKTVTEQARELVRNRSLRRHSSRSSLRELEETIRGIDNRGGDSAAMVYRYVEEVHRFDLVRYAKHLFTKFIMPDPAANYHVASKAGARGEAIVSETFDLLSYVDSSGSTPVTKKLSPDGITQDNWHTLAAIFELADPIPPPQKKTAMAVLKTGGPGAGPNASYQVSTDITVPEGYMPRQIFFQHDLSTWDGNEDRSGALQWGLMALVGRKTFALKWWGDTNLHYGPFYLEPIPIVNGTLPVAINAHSYNWGTVSVEVEMEPSDNAVRLWQLEYFQQLIDARRQKVGDKPSAAEVLDLIEVADLSDSPTVAKAMIDREIRLLCVRYVLGADLNGLNTVDRNVAYPQYPIIDQAATNQIQLTLDFLNSVFDFDKMTYQFLPSYLGGREHRMTAFQNRPTGLLGEFVRAGAVEILLPVRKNYEEALFYFLQTGLIMNGDDIPLPYDRRILELYEEIVDARALDSSEDGILVSSWFKNMPTEHVLLQEGAQMPDWRADGVLPGGVSNTAVAPGVSPVPDVN
jgi:hypothetical protein